jgi:SAM-dependent methyltransferase
MPTPDEVAGQMAAESLAADDPTGWFERLYSAAAAGQTQVPWDRGEPSRFLVEWASRQHLSGAGRRAIVVGCGLGDDAEYISGLGFATTAFDISATAVRTARRRHPGSAVRYDTANLLSLPAGWLESFDLVVESLTLQAMPDPPRARAIASVGRLVAPGGTLVAIARAREPGEPFDDPPPWALTRAEIDALAAPGLRPVRIEDMREAGPPPARRWRAEFTRPADSEPS